MASNEGDVTQTERPRRGRPRIFTSEQRRISKKRSDRESRQRAVTIRNMDGVNRRRWEMVKNAENLQSNTDVLAFLLARYEQEVKSASRKAKNVPPDLQDYTFLCKTCGSCDVVVRLMAQSPQTRSSQSNGERIKMECTEEEEGSLDLQLDDVRPINLFCNVSQSDEQSANNNTDEKQTGENDEMDNEWSGDNGETAHQLIGENDETADETDKIQRKEKCSNENITPGKKRKLTKKLKSNRTISDKKVVHESDISNTNRNDKEEVEGSRRSVRLKGKTRISFSDMNKFGIKDECSENSEDDDDDDDEDDDDFNDVDEFNDDIWDETSLEDEQLDETTDNSESMTKRKEKRILHEIDVDPDFDPESDDDVDDKKSVENNTTEEMADSDGVKPKGKRGRKRKDRADDSDEFQWWKKSNGKSGSMKEVKEAKKKEKQRKKERAQQIKELRAIHRSGREKCEDVIVSLEDHEDKYELTMFTSKSQKDRNIDIEHKSYYRYTCKMCDGQFNATDKKSMESHIKLHLQGQLTCGDCGITFSMPLALFNHKIDHHIEKFNTCEFCAEQFYSPNSLKTHLAKKHDQKPYKCPKCKDYFSCRADKKAHVISEHPDLAAQCGKCGEFFFGPERLQCHERGAKCRMAAEGKKKVVCTECGKSVSKAGLKKHMDTIHLKIQCHKCEVCSFTTNSTQSIKNHRIRHTGQNIKCKLKQYPQEWMQAAVEDVKKNGLSIRKAAEIHKVKCRTLNNHMNGMLKGERVHALSKDEEQALRVFIAHNQERDVPLTSKMVKVLAKSIVEKSGRQNCLGPNGPSGKWLGIFLNVIQTSTWQNIVVVDR